MTGRKKLEIGSIFPYFVPPAGTPPSLFRLFANATHKINHARRNFTFTCKITPRVNFYMFRTLNDTLYRSSFLRLLLRSIVSDNCMIVSCDEKLSKIVAGVNSQKKLREILIFTDALLVPIAVSTAGDKD